MPALVYLLTKSPHPCLSRSIAMPMRTAYPDECVLNIEFQEELWRDRAGERAIFEPGALLYFVV
jgi:hypothetical protein